jgi:hypothetical protein
MSTLLRTSFGLLFGISVSRNLRHQKRRNRAWNRLPSATKNTYLRYYQVGSYVHTNAIEYIGKMLICTVVLLICPKIVVDLTQTRHKHYPEVISYVHTNAIE